MTTTTRAPAPGPDHEPPPDDVDAKFEIRTRAAEIAKWKGRAHHDGMTLGAWIRQRCNTLELVNEPVDPRVRFVQNDLEFLRASGFGRILDYVIENKTDIALALRMDSAPHIGTVSTYPIDGFYAITAWLTRTHPRTGESTRHSTYIVFHVSDVLSVEPIPEDLTKLEQAEAAGGPLTPEELATLGVDP